MKRAWEKRTAVAIAIAAVSVACVKVPDSIKTTFAPHQGSEPDNFSASAPHSIAPPDTELTQAVVAGPAAPDASTGIEGICARDPNPSAASSSPDGGTSFTSMPTTGMRNCLQDAGNP